MAARRQSDSNPDGSQMPSRRQSDGDQMACSTTCTVGPMRRSSRRIESCGMKRPGASTVSVCSEGATVVARRALASTKSSTDAPAVRGQRSGHSSGEW